MTLTITVERESLLGIVAALLSDPTVVEALAAAARALGDTINTGPKFMTRKEYAAHVKVSTGSLDTLTANMTEGLHYSRVGSRVRYDVAHADEFIAHRKTSEPASTTAADLKTFARDQAGRRPVKRPTTERV